MALYLGFLNSATLVGLGFTRTEIGCPLEFNITNKLLA